MTPIDLITLALKQAGVVGVGQTPLSEDANDAFSHLNMMLSQWNRRRWLVYRLKDVFCAAYGASFYRIGDGQALNTGGRVTGIASAYWRQSGAGGDRDKDFSDAFGADFGPKPTISPSAVDIPLRVISSREEYSRITMKGYTGFPVAVWLDADYPLGKLYVWPSPGYGEIHVTVQEQLDEFPDLTTDIALPNEYRDALFQNLVVRLRSAYGRPPDPVVIQLAKVALNTIRGANAQIATLQMPDNLPVRTGSGDAFGGGFASTIGEIGQPSLPTLPEVPPIPDPGTIIVTVDGGREG